MLLMDSISNSTKLPGETRIAGFWSTVEELRARRSIQRNTFYFNNMTSTNVGMTQRHSGSIWIFVSLPSTSFEAGLEIHSISDRLERHDSTRQSRNWALSEEIRPMTTEINHAVGVSR